MTVNVSPDNSNDSSTSVKKSSQGSTPTGIVSSSNTLRPGETSNSAIVEVNFNNVTSSFVVLPYLIDGTPLGGLYVPPSLVDIFNASLTITNPAIGPTTNPANQQLVSGILNITLAAGGNSITQLNSSLTICLGLSDQEQANKVCLSFFDERKNKWRCQDKCLRFGPPPGNLICGETDHLTNFALLLSDNSRDKQECGSVSRSNTIAWIAMALIIGAILVVAVAVLILEIQIRLRIRKRERFISKFLSFRSTDWPF